MKRSVVVAALGADPIAHGLGLSRTIVFAFFSGALLLSAVLGPSVGRAIDNRGGRGVLALSNLVLATGLVLPRCRPGVCHASSCLGRARCRYGDGTL